MATKRFLPSVGWPGLYFFKHRIKEHFPPNKKYFQNHQSETFNLEILTIFSWNGAFSNDETKSATNENFQSCLVVEVAITDGRFNDYTLLFIRAVLHLFAIFFSGNVKTFEDISTATSRTQCCMLTFRSTFLKDVFS